MMNETALWLTAVFMGIYQGLNPPIGWLRAAGRGLETRSERAILQSTGSLAFGHFLSMVVLLVPVAILVAGLPGLVIPMGVLMRAAWLISFGLIGFGIYKLIRPHHPRFIVRIKPDQVLRWSFWMGLTHCGSAVMMVPMLINLTMVSAMAGFSDSATQRMISDATLALTMSAAMTVPLFLTGSVVALAVTRRFGIGAITRYWINLDLGWAAMFILMGIMGVAMG
ncbi:MAG: hypothetical protein PHT60_07900 [Acidiphilium sp.]|nr:hypothetical protein [Acidiphilium sp.]MDD4935685.1 hypothetical protein [Acidiphilium sp.]